MRTGNENMNYSTATTVISNGQYTELSDCLLEALILGVMKSGQRIIVCQLLRKKGFSILKQLINDGKTSKSRKLAARLLCDLAFEDEEAQQYICDMYGLGQIYGKICVNKMPESVKEKIKEQPETLKLIKNLEEGEKRAKFWTFPEFTPTTPIKTPKGEGDSEALVHNFPDPHQFLLGFLILSKPDRPTHPIKKLTFFRKPTPGKKKSELSETMVLTDRSSTKTPVNNKKVKKVRHIDYSREKKKWSKSVVIQDPAILKEEIKSSQDPSNCQQPAQFPFKLNEI